MTMLLVAIVAAGLWLLVDVEREHTRIRAPWTGLTTVASALAFVAVGLVGRGWKALLAAGTAAVAAVYLSPLVLRGHGRWSHQAPAVESSCDPGCIPFEFFAGTAAVLAVILAATGIAARRAALRVTRRRSRIC